MAGASGRGSVAGEDVFAFAGGTFSGDGEENGVRCGDKPGRWSALRSDFTLGRRLALRAILFLVFN